MSAALIAPPAVRLDQAELLRAFDLPIALMQDAEALERITAELVETKAADGVRYVEIRWGPLLHVAARPVAGGRDRGRLRRSARLPRAGPAPSSGSSAPRCGRTIRRRTLELAETAAHFRDRGLTGWDLAGPEEAFPDPLLHRRAFDAAREGGLRITLHAGEWGGAAQVRRALEVEPERIAHGPGAIDDPALCAELIGARRHPRPLPDDRTCRPGSCPSVAAHPLARLHRRGRAGHAQHGRHDRVRHHAVRGVPSRGRGDRADAARALGDRPARARRRLRRRADAGAAAAPSSTPGPRRSRSSGRPAAERALGRR